MPKTMNNFDKIIEFFARLWATIGCLFSYYKETDEDIRRANRRAKRYDELDREAARRARIMNWVPYRHCVPESSVEDEVVWVKKALKASSHLFGLYDVYQEGHPRYYVGISDVEPAYVEAYVECRCDSVALVFLHWMGNRNEQFDAIAFFGNNDIPVHLREDETMELAKRIFANLNLMAA